MNTANNETDLGCWSPCVNAPVTLGTHDDMMTMMLQSGDHYAFSDALCWTATSQDDGMS